MNTFSVFMLRIKSDRTHSSHISPCPPTVAG
jgi:hypothetical protein